MSTWSEHADPNATCMGFRMSEPDPDHSMLHCLCGETITWSGAPDETWNTWVKDHTEHQAPKAKVSMRDSETQTEVAAEAVRVTPKTMPSVIPAWTEIIKGQWRLCPPGDFDCVVYSDGFWGVMKREVGTSIAIGKERSVQHAKVRRKSACIQRADEPIRALKGISHE